jgi:hypothetical protein
MTLSHSPKIVRDGLVLSLDPANQKSLPHQNLLLQSENLASTPWNQITGTGGAITRTNNSLQSPDGSNTATLINVSTFASGSSIYQDINSPGTKSYVASVYMKPGTMTGNITLAVFYLTGGTTQGFNAIFNPQTGSFVSTTGISGISENVGNGWFKLSLSATGTDALNTRLRFQIYSSSSGTIYYWGAQLRDAFSGEEYIKTESSAIYESTNIINMVDSSVVGTPSGKSPSNLDNSLSYLATDLSYIGFPSLPEIQFLGNSPYTLEAWVYPTINPGASNWTGIFDRESNPGIGRDGYNLYFLGSSGSNTYFASDRFVAGSGVYPSITVNQSQSVNNWNHIVVRYNGINVKIYRNTVSGSSFASTGSITNTSKQLTIGVRGGQYFTGKIGITNIYNIALSDDQIKQNFNALRGRYGV